jgi:ATP-binding cassette subfamily E protein 1
LIQENAITGIIGRNGIGKSTVINVLSRNLKANFGNYDEKDLSDEDYFLKLKELFKGTALQNYFEKLKKEEIKIALKPQQIVNIPKLFKGKVIDLLKRVNPNQKEIEKIAKELNIKQVLDREISVLSGGELQRVAISSCLLKPEVNFFVLDEITNYLDVYERLNSAKIISLKSKDKTSLLVEHDLIVLDYLTDFIQIMYGSQGAFGMLTGVKSAKVGINDYLEGYVKEENVKFRDKPISFDKDSVQESLKVDKLTDWKAKKIDLGGFKLNVNPGEIKRGECVGIVGRNALGKSTFVKSISEEGIEGLFISYKPQLIPRSDMLVMSDLMQYNTFEDNFYKLNILEPLKIDAILEKQIDQLSGGELQRYAIAKCLLQDADLYLLDEPTAFLDVEDRLKISKMLKNFIELKKKSAFIIDHDLVFMDYLSERLLVFDGKPGIEGNTHGPLSMRDGMNHFLKELKITFRRDESNKRPRVNKEGSVKDQEQKKSGEYYYS